jgi:uncharacterized membrane protein
MEFLQLLLLFASAFLVWRRPEKERLAFGLLLAGIALMILLYSLGTRTSLLPGVNY